MFMNGSVFVMLGALGLQLVDPLQYFSWGIYAGAGVLYSALSFTGELSKEGAQIFSKQNARSLSWIFAIHASFLVTLMGLMRIVPFIYPSLPNWMTDLFPHQNPPLSAFDLVFVLALIGLSHVERRWLYLDSEIESRDREPTSAEPSAPKEE
jgi:hypothetical protein